METRLARAANHIALIKAIREFCEQAVQKFALANSITV